MPTYAMRHGSEQRGSGPSGWSSRAAAAPCSRRVPAAFPLGIGFLGVALAFGLTVMTMAYAVGHVSGGHFNPAVTVGLAASGRFSWRDVLPYVVTQVVGARSRRRRSCG